MLAPRLVAQHIVTERCRRHTNLVSHKCDHGRRRRLARTETLAGVA
jgi:hypothetical protein